MTPPAVITPPVPVPGSLTVQWFGQSGVLLITPDGNSILIDPPGPASGYQLPFLGAVNALLVSRDEPDYNYVVAANSTNVLVAARNGQFIPVDAQLSDARIQAVQTGGAGGEAVPNGIWVIDSPGLYMVHLGGLQGPLPASAQLRPRPDLLFLPVGGGPVLDATTAAQIVTALKPRVVIPLNYKTTATRDPLAPVDDFLAAGYRDVIRPGHTWTVKPSDLKSGAGGEQGQPRIVVLDYK
jgi:L-ascorbate metabolism protein UlaG (beta-lactamase superfamily)